MRPQPGRRRSTQKNTILTGSHGQSLVRGLTQPLGLVDVLEAGGESFNRREHAPVERVQDRAEAQEHESSDETSSSVLSCLGSEGYSKDLASETPTRWQLILRKEFENQARLACSSPSGLVTVAFQSPDTYRLQLRTVSCDLWFPEKLVAGLEAALDYIILTQHTCPAQAVALDAASLCHLGQINNDVRLFNQGLRWRAKALELLRRELSEPKDRQNRALVGAINSLQITEAFTSMSFVEKSWLQHSRGLTGLLDNLDDDGEKPLGYDQLLHTNFYLFHFWSGLVERKRIKAFGKNEGTVLSCIAERVPGVLEMVDEACQKGPLLDTTEAVRLVNILSGIEEELNMWSQAWNPCMRSAPFSIVNSEKMFHYKPPSGKRPKNPFPLSMEFKTFYDALDHIVCTASLLEIRKAMLDTCSMLNNPKLGSPNLKNRIISLTAAASSCADSLCMAIPYFQLFAHGRYGQVVASHPLRVAVGWYKYLQDTGSKSADVKLNWCGQVADRIKARGIRPL